MSELSFDEEQFCEVEQRLDSINNLKAKYGATIEDINAYKEASVKKLDKLKNYDIYLDELKMKEAAARKKLEKISGA